MANSTAGTRAVALPALRIDKVDREFLPAALELLETPPSPVRVAAIWVICLFFAAALAWSYFGWLEIYAVAQGRIQPSGRSKVVQPLDPGRVVGIAVENGSRVAAGDLLVELDSRETGADREEQKRDLESALAEGARRRVAIAAARLGDKEALKVVYPAGFEQRYHRPGEWRACRRSCRAFLEPGKPSGPESGAPCHARSPQSQL